MSTTYRIKVIRAKDNTPYYYCGWDDYKRSHIFNEHLIYAKRYKKLDDVTLTRNVLKEIFWLSIKTITIIRNEE